MSEFSVKEVAINIGTSTQYVYQQMAYLIDNHLAYRNEKDKPIIYDKGLEYLREKRKENLKVVNKGLQNENKNTNESIDNTENKNFASNENLQQVIDIYKNLYEEQKQETEHWKKLFMEKDKALMEVTGKFLLPPIQEEKKEIKKKKWKFWDR